MDCNVIKRR